MKLSSKYLTRGNYEIKDNRIFSHYSAIFQEAFRSPGNFDPSQEKITSSEYTYNLSNSEKNFYKTLYVSHGERIHDDKINELFSNASPNDIQIGQSEYKLLSYPSLFFGNTTYYGDKEICIVKGPIGVGKTVLLKYVWLYLIESSPQLKQKYIPVYISVDNDLLALETVHGDKSIEENISELYLVPKLSHIIFKLNKNLINDEPFWTYLKDFAEFSKFNSLENVNEILLDKADEKNYQILLSQKYEKRNEIMRTRSFVLFAAKYLCNRSGKIPILIFDNVDPLSNKIQAQLVHEGNSICERYGLPVIVTMRDTTYNFLASQDGGIMATYQHFDVELRSEEVYNILERRIFLAKSKIKSRTAALTIEEENIRVTQKKDDEVMLALVDILLTDECLSFFQAISNWNLRKLFELLEVYLRSGLHEEHRLFKGILEKRSIGETNFENRWWILLTSILTANYKTHFSDPCPNESVLRGIANVYCNNSGKYNRYSIRLHLLNYLDRFGSVSFKVIRKEYIKVKPDTIVKEEVEEAILYAVKRLLHCKLLTSSEYFLGISDNEIRNLSHIEITDAGRYYLRKFANYFEYLAYMKDDINFLDDVPDIQDCIQVTSREGRYLEIYKVLRYIYSKECEFFEQLKPNKMRLFYRNYSRFGDNTPFITYAPVNHMVKFGRQSALSQNVIAQYIELQESMATFMEKINCPLKRN